MRNKITDICEHLYCNKTDAHIETRAAWSKGYWFPVMFLATKFLNFLVIVEVIAGKDFELIGYAFFALYFMNRAVDTR